MEDVYMKGFGGQREWCSDIVKLKPYFEEFSQKLSVMTNKKVSEIDILQHFVPQSNQLSEEELSALTNDSNPARLTTMFDNDLIKKTILRKSTKDAAEKKRSLSRDSDSDGQTSPVVSNRSKTKRSQSKDNNLDGQVFTIGDKRRKNRIKTGQHCLRKELPIDTAEKRGSRDLIAYKHFLVSFRIHEPFNYKAGENSRPGRCLQQICVLGHQTLSALRDKILCETEFQDTRGDISEHPDEPVIERARDIYHSSMFYFNNIFYVDCRKACNTDYSRPIKMWAKSRGIKLGETVAMESTSVEDLEIRFGYPYLFMHQGCCEHLVIINDARLLKPQDSLFSTDYPLMTKSTHLNMVYCMTCSRLPARWIVRNSDLLAHDPTYMCKPCFKMLHYVDGKKVCDFKAWQYWQRSIIM